ncbi:MAG TPA: SBBP repeat-containing protein [Acidimicrobiales bacterium]|nr:SBBP repeat-containing protein [Acidimicrobiales bacterium]
MVLLAVAGVFAATFVRETPHLQTPHPHRQTSENVAALLRHLPLNFEATASEQGFVARAIDYRVLLDGGDAAVSMPAGDVRINLPGRNGQPVIRPQGPTTSTTNYFLGDDPAGWRTGVGSFGSVAYEGVWPGVDVVWHGQRDQVEMDFVVAPGADTGLVAMQLGGTAGLRIDSNGDLVMAVGTGDARLRAPTLYQDGVHGREFVTGAFVLRGPDEVGFVVGPHDSTRSLVIDPVLVSATYLGGSSSDTAFGVAIDDAGNVYVTGSTESSDFPTEGPQQPDLVEADGVRTDAFVTKLNAAGTALVYSTYLGGKGKDISYGIAVGSDGSPYVVGSTDSTDFPMSKPFRKTYGGGGTDAFVTKLGPQGAVIDYSTFLGGGGTDTARGIALDQSGAAVVAGSTSSPDFPTAKAFQGALRDDDEADGFVTKVSPSGADLVYSTYLGGAGPDHAVAVAVDGSGAAYVTGDTRSTDFPTANAFQKVANGAARLSETAMDVFVTKLEANGSALAYSTYLGGGDSDQAAGVVVDRDGSAYVTGNTGSTDFPVVRPVQEKKNGDTDAFASRLSSAGTTLIFSTYLGGSGSDSGTAMTIDRLGRASFTGVTASNDFPMAKPFQATKAGGFTEAFVSTLGTDGSSLAFSSYLGGRDEDLGSAIVADRDGNLYVAGYTNSADFPTARPYQPAKGGGVGDGFVVKIGEQAAKAAGPVSAPSPARERRIQFLLATTIVLFAAAIAQTVWLRRRRIPTGPPPVSQSAFGGMAVGRIEGERYEPPRVRSAAPIASPIVDTDEGEEAPLPLVAPIRPLRTNRGPVPPEPELDVVPAAPETPAPSLPAPEPESAGDPTLAVDVIESVESTLLPPVADDVPGDPALSESWAEAPVSDDLWAPPEPWRSPSEAVEGDVDIAVPELLPEPEAFEFADDDVEAWQMMSVDPEPAAAPTVPAPDRPAQSLSELLDEDLPIPESPASLDDDLSISDLLDENLAVPDDHLPAEGEPVEPAAEPEP